MKSHPYRSLLAIVLVGLVGLAGCDRGRNADQSTSSAKDNTTATTNPGATTPNATTGPASSMQESASKAGQALDDATITTKVKAALAAEKDVSALNISVDTNQGRVTLSGTVPPAQIGRAEQIARGVQGVQEVINQLKPANTSS